MMGPTHGFIVNWFGHKRGYRNFDSLNDNSKNTLPLDFLMMGELYQNNHHYKPKNINFAVKWYEYDFWIFGYTVFKKNENHLLNMTSKVKDYINVFIILSFACIIALAGGYKSLSYNGYPILILCMITSFLVHWIIFIPSFLAKTEKFYDITGTVAYLITLYIASSLTSYSSGESLEIRTKIIIGMVSFWAIRLGVFLFIRVLRVGEDRRFREAKKSFSKYLVWWTMSGLWVFLTTANALTLIINKKKIG